MKKTFFALCAFMLTGMTMAQNPSAIPISDLQGLKDMALTGHYILTEDITLDGDWVPLGTPPSGTSDTDLDNYSFNGTFDGQGHTIKGLTFKISDPDAIYMGLFGRIGSEGVVENLNVDNSDYSDDSDDSSFGIYAAAGDVNGTRNIGTIAGVNHGKIINCRSNVNVYCHTGSIDGGGIAGENKGLIKNCVYYGGEICRNDYTDMKIGGIVGSNETDGILQNCFFQATLQGSYDSPLYGQSRGDIYDCAYHCGNANSGGVKLEGRTFYKVDRNWNTLCLPFDVTIQGSVFSDAIVMELDTDSEGYAHPTGIVEGEDEAGEPINTLYLNFKAADRIIAGKPYLVRWNNPDETNELVDPSFPGADLADMLLWGETPKGVTSADGNVTFMGTYFSKDIEETGGDNTVLFLKADAIGGFTNTLYYPDAPMSINSLRAYFQLNNGYVGGIYMQGGGSSINVFNLNFGEGSTGLKKVELNIPSDSEEVYDLSGRRVDNENLRPGIYIKNGKKYLIRK